MILDWTSIAAIITALGVLLYNIGQQGKSKADAAACMAEAAANITEAAEKRIEQLTLRIERLEKRVSELEQENAELRGGIKLLIQQICGLGYKPVWDWPRREEK